MGFSIVTKRETRDGNEWLWSGGTSLLLRRAKGERGKARNARGELGETTEDRETRPSDC